MNTPRIAFTGLDQYPNFEFYSTEEMDDRIVKKYNEDDWGKRYVLKNEFEWLQEVPPYLNYHFPGLYQCIIQIQNNQNGIELHLSNPKRKSLAQEILSGTIDEMETVKYLDSAIFILCEYVYPIHTKENEFNSLHLEFDTSFFIDQISLFDNIYNAKKEDSKDPFISTILNTHNIIVNQTVCPSVAEIIDYIKIKNFNINPKTRIHTIHGNFNLNTILVEPGTKSKTELITFINPKNHDLRWIYSEQFLGFPVIDFSSLLLNMECYLDEINYGGYQFENGSFGYDFHVNFQLNDTFSKVYEKGLQFLNSKRAYFAELQGISINEFTILSICTEWLQLLNRIIEQDRTKEDNMQKSFVMTGILGLLGKRLLETVQNIDEYVISDKRLELG